MRVAPLAAAVLLALPLCPATARVIRETETTVSLAQVPLTAMTAARRVLTQDPYAARIVTGTPQPGTVYKLETTNIWGREWVYVTGDGKVFGHGPRTYCLSSPAC